MARLWTKLSRVYLYDDPDSQGLDVDALAGWLAGQVVKGSGFVLIGNIVIGIIGSYIGGFIFTMLGFFPAGGFIGSLITAFVGAVILIYAVKLITQK